VTPPQPPLPPQPPAQPPAPDGWESYRRYRRYGRARGYGRARDFSGGEWDGSGPWTHGPWRRRAPEPPPWWPEGEAWPPENEFPWRRMKRLFFVRIAVSIAIVLILVLAGPIVLVVNVLGALGLSGPGTVGISSGVVILLLVTVALLARGAGHIASPIGDLIEAAGRVEEGDYTARVAWPRRGPRELRSLAHAFNAMTARLQTDEDQRRTLLADVSHELRTPLAVLQGELEAMIDGIHATDETHLAAALDEIRMMTGLVEDLRTLTLAEAGTLALHREQTDVAVLAGEVASSFEAIATTAGVALRVDVAPGLPLVDLDPLRIRQVLSNLVANALRYAPEGTEVTIEAVAGRKPGGVAASALAASAAAAVTVSVVDRGPGIPPELLPHIFERFAKSPESRGTGLGLAIARRLVEAHGGTIRAERPGETGTAIVFELPLGPEADADQAPGA
jgi:two-component system, OmpR family, sensor histidine kinase BaeS